MPHAAVQPDTCTVEVAEDRKRQDEAALFYRLMRHGPPCNMAVVHEP